jgi:hypothetical protein
MAWPHKLFSCLSVLGHAAKGPLPGKLKTHLLKKGMEEAGGLSPFSYARLLSIT